MSNGAPLATLVWTGQVAEPASGRPAFSGVSHVERLERLEGGAKLRAA